MSEQHERIYLVYPSSEYLYIELRLLRGMACFRKQKRIFSKKFLVKQLISLDKYEFFLQSFHDGVRYYSPPYIHEKEDPEVFRTLRSLFDLPSAFIREVNDTDELDYWDETCLPFPVEAEYQKQEYILIKSISDQLFSEEQDKVVKLTLVIPQLDYCWDFSLHMSQLSQQLSADKVELIVRFLQDETRDYISTSEDTEVFSSIRSFLHLPSDKIELVFESKCFWRNNEPQLLLHLIRDYDTPERFDPDEFFVPHNMYSEDDRGHDGLVRVFLSELQQLIPVERVEHLLALLRDPSCPFISRRDHPEEFALIYPLFISPIPELPGIFQLADPIIMYSKSNTSEFYLNIGIYCIKDHGPSIYDEVNINSLEELKGLFPSNVLELIFQSLQEETRVIMTENDNAKVFNSLYEAIEKTLYGDEISG